MAGLILVRLLNSRKGDATLGYDSAKLDLALTQQKVNPEAQRIIIQMHN